MKKFHRKKGQRQSFMKGLANNLIMKERIETTTTRAKAMRPMVERLVTIAKKQYANSAPPASGLRQSERAHTNKEGLAALRSLLAKLPKQSAEKLYFDIAPRYKERPGGYLRITQEGKARKRDAAQLSIIEFVK